VTRAAIALLVAGCSSPALVDGGGGGAPLDAATARSAAREAPPREEQIRRYLEPRGITISAHAEAAWSTLGGEAAIVVELRNAGSKEFRLVGERTRGAWPFSTDEHARAELRVDVTFATPSAGVRTLHDSLPIDDLETIVVPAGGERSLRLPLRLALPDAAECAVALVRPILHPLAIEVDSEPERVVTLHLPEVRVAFAPPEAAAAAEGGEALLEAALDARPELVVAAAVLSGERDPVGTVDRLILALPGRDARARRARCTALQWLTGARLGDGVERWRGWWDSEEGRKFASAPRKLP